MSDKMKSGKIDKMFKIFNHSSENMTETDSDSVDLIVTSPPYNIGTRYLDFRDADSFEIYLKTLEKIFSECIRARAVGFVDNE